jgi:hypothetical protein
MTDRLDDKLRAHYALLGRQPMTVALEEGPLKRRRREPSPARWRGLAIAVATAAAVFAIIAVPLFARLNSAPNPASTGTTTLGGIRAEFVKLVTTDSAAWNSELLNAERACAGSGAAAQQTSICVTATSGLSAELMHTNTDFNTATVPGGVAAEMAQLVQALGAFASAQASGQSLSPTTVMADATTVETDLQALQHALASS